MTAMNDVAAQGIETARRLASEQHGVVGRRQLYDRGVPRWLVRRELRVGRWQVTGTQSVGTHNGPLSREARCWAAVIELGPRAAIAGVTALQLAGVTSLTDEALHVIVPKGAKRRRVIGVVRHESRRWRAEDLVSDGLRRARPAAAALQAALWAKTIRQAQYFLILVVQQGLTTPQELAGAVASVRRHRFRRAMVDTAAELVGGVRSLGELDVATAMRSRGLPEPERQALRRRPNGKEYLDADFPAYQVSMEVDGAQHDEPWARARDVVRDIRLASEGRTVVRIPLEAWRLDASGVLDALEGLFRARGWRPRAA
jgi:hypothetical protein